MYCCCGLPLLNFYECVESVLEKKKKMLKRPKDHENVSCRLVAVAKLPLLYETNIFWIIFQSILSSVARSEAKSGKSGPKKKQPCEIFILLSSSIFIRDSERDCRHRIEELFLVGMFYPCLTAQIYSLDLGLAVVEVGGISRQLL